MVQEFTKEMRFGVGVDGDLRGASFKVERRPSGDVYLMYREIAGIKLSFHASGKNRLAVASGAPRPPLEPTTNLSRILAPGEFKTCARLILTTETDWEGSRGSLGKNSVLIQPPPAPRVAMVSLGFTSHHPDEHEQTSYPGNIGVFKVAEDWFLTLTHVEFSLDHFLHDVLVLHAPHRESRFIETQLPIGGRADRVDNVLYFRSKLNTYNHWVHHNIPKWQTQLPAYDWRRRNRLVAGLHSAHQLSRSGVRLGY